jgi:mannose-6-phosphate isomerase-like protein (cupin superfamily)
MKFTLALTIVLAAAPALAQTRAAQTPVKDAQIFSAAALKQQFAQAAADAASKGIGGGALADYGSHNLRISTRTTNGGAEVHAHFADVFYVTEGHATLITGGTVIDPTDKGNGETLGKSIQGGTSKETGPGDLIHIPAGLPHQLLIPKGTVFSYLVVKVRE